ncbi:MAG: YceI family protein [Reichenbachiella sp.]
MKKSIYSVALILFSSSLLVAQVKWKADPANSNVQFEVTHLAISSVTGKFTSIDCTINSPKKSFDGAVIEAKVSVNDIATGNLTRDKHLKEDDFFNNSEFPTMVFKSTSFKKASTTRYELSGNLTIRDVTKEISFPAEYSGMINLGEKTISVFKAEFTINRFDYNLKWDDTLDTGSLVVGEDVFVSLSLEFVKQ